MNPYKQRVLGDYKMVFIGPAVMPIPDHPGYWVSRDGEVYSTKRREHRVLVPMIDRDGYHKVNLSNRNRIRQTFIHHVVLWAFRGPGGAMMTRHLDGNPGNNALDNLVWGTYKENWDDKRRHGRATQGENSPSAKLTTDEVLAIRRQHKNGRGRTCLARDYGVCVETIWLIVTRRSWSHV